MNKNKKKTIFSSISILLIIALLGGTFAWFYLTDKVTVDFKNEVQCVGGGSLEVKLKDGGWGSLVTHTPKNDFTFSDISSNGLNFFRPASVIDGKPSNFKEATANQDYMDFEVSFRSLYKVDVYLAGDSFILPNDPLADNDDAVDGEVENFSKDYVAGAMRVAIVDEEQTSDTDKVKMVWAPNPEYHLDTTVTPVTFNAEDPDNPESYYSYYYAAGNPDSEGVYNCFKRSYTSADYLSKKFVIGSTGTSETDIGNSPILCSLDPGDDGGYAEKTLKVRVWFEGTDRECHSSLAGGYVNINLKFIGIAQPEESTSATTAATEGTGGGFDGDGDEGDFWG